MPDRSVIDGELATSLRDFDHRQSSLQVLDLDFQFPLGSEHLVELASSGHEISLASIEDFHKLFRGCLERLMMLEPVGQILADLVDAVLLSLVSHIANAALEIVLEFENRILGLGH